MTVTQNGSQETQHSQTGSASTEQSSSSSDAKTQRKANPADKFKQVNDLITGALTPDAARAQNAAADADDDDNVSQGTDEGQREPTGDDRSVPSGDGDDAGAADEPSVSSPPRTLQEVADKVGMKVSDLYKLEVPLKDGGTMTLGAMKDAHRSAQEVRQEVVTRAAELDERETVIAGEQRLWGQIGAELTKALNPQTVNALKRRLSEQEQKERQNLLRTMPELRDQAKFDAFRDEVVQTLARYGYQPHEIVVGDHRQLLVVRDLARAQKRLKELRDYKPTPKTPNSVQSKGRGDTARSNKQRIINNARNSKHPSDKTQAVAALIKGA